MLILEDVTKHFQRLRAVDGVSMTVSQGEIIGLIGPNGSGKSTLLSVIAGTLAPDSGRIIFVGHQIAGAAPDAIFRLGLGRSFQDPSLFQRMTVLDNTLLPAQDQRGESPLLAAWHAAWRDQERILAGAAQSILGRLQLESLHSQVAGDLSGGQMKLLELGRTLMGRPTMMLLDEPTAGVAPNLAYTIFQQIEALRRSQGITFLIVEHRLEILFDFVDSLYVMHLGQVLAQGTPDQIVRNDQVRQVYLGQ